MNRGKGRKLTLTISKGGLGDGDRGSCLASKSARKSELQRNQGTRGVTASSRDNSLIRPQMPTFIQSTPPFNHLNLPQSQHPSTLLPSRPSIIKNIPPPPCPLNPTLPHQTPSPFKHRSISNTLSPQGSKINVPVKSNIHHQKVLPPIPVQPIPNQYYLTEKPRDLVDENEQLRSALRSSQKENRRLVGELLEYRRSVSRNNPLSSNRRSEDIRNSEYTTPIYPSPLPLDPYLNLKSRQDKQGVNNSIIDQVKRRESIILDCNESNEGSRISSIRSNMLENLTNYSELRVTSCVKSRGSQSSTKIQSTISKQNQGFKGIDEIKQPNPKGVIRNSIGIGS